MSIEDRIKELLIEEFGHRFELDKYTGLIYDEVIKIIENNRKHAEENGTFNKSFTVKIIPFTTPIVDLTVKVFLYDDGSTTGNAVLSTARFDSYEKDGVLIDSFCNVRLELKISLTELDDIREIISHELLHIFQYSQKKKKDIHYPLNAILKPSITFRVYPEWDEFLNIIYFTLPIEIDARVHETYEELTKKNFNSFEEIYSGIENTKAWIIADRILNFNVESLNNIKSEILQELINKFNEKYKANLKTHEINYFVLFPDKPQRFIKLWKRRFQFRGELFKTKLRKLTYSFISKFVDAHPELNDHEDIFD